MKTDYRQIAHRYDKNQIRHEIAPDSHIASLKSAAPAVLDLACGTGNYLAAQTKHAQHAHIQWTGLDASDEMLALARSKELPAKLLQGQAEALPFADESFDYVVCRFAFHHFDEKSAALSEMLRVLKPGGSIRMESMVPELSEGWWLYRYFPEAIELDNKRFWSLSRLDSEVRARGHRLTTEARQVPPVKFSKIIWEARNKDISQLHIVTPVQYENGVKDMESDLASQGDRDIDVGVTLANFLISKA